MALRKYMAIVALMVFTLLVDMPLSNGYDFIGKLPRKIRIRAILPDTPEEEALIVPEIPEEPEVPPIPEIPEVEEMQEDTNVFVPGPVIEPTDTDPHPIFEEEEQEEDTPVQEVVPESVKETIDEATVNEPTPSLPEVGEGTLPEPEDIPVQEEKSAIYEIEYDTLPVGNVMDKLPTSKSGNYVIVYRSDNCIYCDKLIDELKGNIGDYVLVSIHCNGVVRDPFYTRLVYQYYPNFLVIKNKSVKYYGTGYRSLEDFKKLL